MSLYYIIYYIYYISISLRKKERKKEVRLFGQLQYIQIFHKIIKYSSI